MVDPLNISFRFQHDLGDFQLNVEQDFPSAGVTALYGHSGSGKSTLLRCIAGLEQADDAYLCVHGEVWEDSAKGIRLPTHKRSIGYVFQEASLFPHLTVLQNLQYGKKRTLIFKRADGLEQSIEMLGIGHLLERMPQHLSGGERQRVAIARALAVCPQLLLMDEPLAALDIRRKREILPFLERLQQELEIPVIYVTHSPAEVKRLANRLLVLDGGSVQVCGNLADTQQWLVDEENLLQ